MTPLDDETHRRLATDLFDQTWSLLGRADRSPADDDRMLHGAHASRFHWGEVGTPANAVRGEWQCSRVYAALGRPEPALHHARRCLELCEGATDVADVDLPFALEALARAHALAGDVADATRWLAMARAAAERIADRTDRELVLRDLATIAP